MNFHICWKFKNAFFFCFLFLKTNWWNCRLSVWPGQDVHTFFLCTCEELHCFLWAAPVGSPEAWCTWYYWSPETTAEVLPNTLTKTHTPPPVRFVLQLNSDVNEWVLVFPTFFFVSMITQACYVSGLQYTKSNLFFWFHKVYNSVQRINTIRGCFHLFPAMNVQNYFCFLVRFLPQINGGGQNVVLHFLIHFF